MKKNKSLRHSFIEIFLLTSILPLICLGVFSGHNISSVVERNSSAAITSELKRTNQTMDSSLEGYRELLSQIYTSSEMVNWLNDINATDSTLAKGQMRRYLEDLSFSRKYIRAITVISHSGEVITADNLTETSYLSSWMNSFSKSKKELYKEVSSDYLLHLFPTEYATHFANRNYYLFHMAHRVINYKKLDSNLGIVILSIDEQMLYHICAPSKEYFTFAVADNGCVMSFGRHSRYIGKKIADEGDTKTQRLKKYQKFLADLNIFSSSKMTVRVLHSRALGADLVCRYDENNLIKAQASQWELMLIGIAMASVMAFIWMYGLSGSITRSVDTIIHHMRHVKEEKTDRHVEMSRDMPMEIKDIATEYNLMLDRLDVMEKAQKEALEKQKDAEIALLEAQINPHFLYNILDTINWMAIDDQEYEISNAISSLASILRYGIAKNKQVVPVKEEIQWLKKYIYLEQVRTVNAFRCEIIVSPEAEGAGIHKLLLQPFIENAIKHGMDVERDDRMIRVEIDVSHLVLKIRIQDNGRGMKPEQVQQIQRMIEGKEDNSRVGLQNAINRLKIYYGKDGKIEITSQEGQGTLVYIEIPAIQLDKEA